MAKSSDTRKKIKAKKKPARTLSDVQRSIERAARWFERSARRNVAAVAADPRLAPHSVKEDAHGGVAAVLRALATVVDPVPHVATSLDEERELVLCLRDVAHKLGESPTGLRSYGLQAIALRDFLVADVDVDCEAKTLHFEMTIALAFPLPAAPESEEKDAVERFRSAHAASRMMPVAAPELFPDLRDASLETRVNVFTKALRPLRLEWETEDARDTAAPSEKRARLRATRAVTACADAAGFHRPSRLFDAERKAKERAVK